MPTRTDEPTISITCTTTSSPSMIFSPGLRVMMSTEFSWRPRRLGGGVVGGGLGEQRGADGGVRRLVDRLVADSLAHHDRRAEVAAEALELAHGPNRDPHADVGGVSGADAVRVGVGELDGEPGEVQE